MNVRELIEQLKNCDGGMEVFMMVGDCREEINNVDLDRDRSTPDQDSSHLYVILASV